MSSNNIVEAERRIEEVRKTGATSLDLGDLGLDRLPESLGDLPGLRRLSLGRMRLEGEDKVKWIYKRAETPLADLSQLRSLQGLKFLYVSGTHVVCVISEKYLHSANCMYELRRIHQRCGDDRRELAERIVPVILPEVEIGGLRQRAPYMKHWKKEHEELEALFRDPDLRPSPESLHEVNLIREFANHVDQILVFVNDILMPRNLDDHLADGFEPVRELLRERLK